MYTILAGLNLGDVLDLDLELNVALDLLPHTRYHLYFSHFLDRIVHLVAAASMQQANVVPEEVMDYPKASSPANYYSIEVAVVVEKGIHNHYLHQSEANPSVASVA
jgi:hypothetical protein